VVIFLLSSFFFFFFLYSSFLFLSLHENVFGVPCKVRWERKKMLKKKETKKKTRTPSLVIWHVDTG